MLGDSYGLVISVISFHVKTYCGVCDIGWYLLMFSFWTKTWLIYFLDKISFIYLFLYNTIFASLLRYNLQNFSIFKEYT